MAPYQFENLLLSLSWFSPAIDRVRSENSGDVLTDSFVHRLGQIQRLFCQNSLLCVVVSRVDKRQ